MEINDELKYKMLQNELAKIKEERDQLALLQSKSIIEIEALNAKLIKSEHVKSSFLSNTRNEIINPLTSIVGLSSEIMHGKNNQPEKIGALLYHEACNLDFQIRNIIAAAEIEAGAIEPIATSVSTEGLVNECLESWTAVIKEKNISITLSINNKIDYFTTDPYQFRLIIGNLISNAIKFSPSSQTIFISLENFKDKLIFKVRNYGSGISSQQQGKIFDRFYQTTEGSSKIYQGQGLGLSIVKEFTDILRGTLHINSNGNFTEITVTLPELKYDLLEDGFLSPKDEILFSDEDIL